MSKWVEERWTLFGQVLGGQACDRKSLPCQIGQKYENHHFHRRTVDMTVEETNTFACKLTTNVTLENKNKFFYCALTKEIHWFKTLEYTTWHSCHLATFLGCCDCKTESNCFSLISTQIL